jgi:hypothetical protein
MGLLDDAIREHLELKRRRGADATEVARQEQEAFGPPRRGDFEPAQGATATAEAPEDHDEPALDEPAAFADEPGLQLDPERTQLHVVENPQPVQDEPPRPHGDPADDLPRAEPSAEPVEEPEPEPEPVHEPEDVEQPTQAFNAEEVRAATTPPPVAPPAEEPEDEQAPEPPAAARPEEDEEGEEEDVLEETPEFLQETPEHDRLWFEQRPPRDFDF